MKSIFGFTTQNKRAKAKARIEERAINAIEKVNKENRLILETI